MFFKGRHLRVTTPKTTNGQIPLLINGVLQTTVTFAPLSAKKSLERKNARLIRTGFKHLAATIEEVTDEPVKAAEPAPIKAGNKKPENKPAAPQNISEALQADDTLKL